MLGSTVTIPSSVAGGWAVCGILSATCIFNACLMRGPQRGLWLPLNGATPFVSPLMLAIKLCWIPASICTTEFKYIHVKNTAKQVKITVWFTNLLLNMYLIQLVHCRNWAFYSSLGIFNLGLYFKVIKSDLNPSGVHQTNPYKCSDWKTLPA